MPNNTEVLTIDGVEYTLIDSTAVHTVDSALSSSSTNPVQNKVINAALNKKPTLLSLGPYTASLADSMYAFTLSAADITLLAAAHDGVMVSFSSSSAFMPSNSISAFNNGTTVFNGVNCKGYSGTYSSATMLTSNTFVMILPTTGSTGTGYIVEGTDDFSSLDATISGLSASKTITSLFETDGVISGVASDIAIAGSQVTSGTLDAARIPNLSADKITSGTMSTQRLTRPTQLQSVNDVTVQSLISDVRANRLAFLPPDQIIIEKTTDGGVTWVDGGTSDSSKMHLFSQTRGAAIAIPLLNGYQNVNCGVRITITAMKYNVPSGTAETAKYNYWNSANVSDCERYTQLKDLYLFVQTSNTSTGGISLKVERASGAASTMWTTVYDSGSTFALIGNTGSDYVSFAQDTFGGATSQTSNKWNYRFTFFTRDKNGGTTGLTPGTTAMGIYDIRGYGDNCWKKPNSLMSSDHLYTWDINQNATFPARVKATELKGLGANYYGTCTTAAATADKVVTCTDFVLAAGARISVRFTNGSTSTGTMTLNVNSTGAKSCGVYVNPGTWQNAANRCEKNEVLEFIYDGTYWVTLTPYALRNYGNVYSRLTSANISWANGGLQYLLATSAMTTGKPPTDASILNMNWDNGTIWGKQLAVGNGNARVFSRAQNGTADWSAWKELPRLSSDLTDGQIILSDEANGQALLKGVNSLEVNKISGSATHTAELENGDYLVFADQSNGGRLKTWTSGLIDTSDTSKYLRHDGTWAEVGSSGGSSIEDKEVYLSRVTNFGDHKYQFPIDIGGTVAWNQLAVMQASSTSGTSNGVTFTDNRDGSFTLNGTATGTFNKDIIQRINVVNTHIYFVGISDQVCLTDSQGYSTKKGDRLLQATSSANRIFRLYVTTGSAYSNLKIYPKVIDLTLAFGPTIADYLYSLESSTAGAGVAKLKSWGFLSKSYYPYNPGSLVSVNPTGIETVGVNLFDKNASGIVKSNYLESTGSYTFSNNWIISDYIEIIQNSDYYFYNISGSNPSYCWYDWQKNYISGEKYNGNTYMTRTAPSNAKYLRVSCNIANIDSFCINISNPLYNGTYYPYHSNTYPISPVELRGILKLDSSNNLYYDGDKRYADGRVERRKYVTRLMGTETGWSKRGNNNHTFGIAASQFGVNAPFKNGNNYWYNDITYVYGSWTKLASSAIDTTDGIYTSNSGSLYVTVMSCSTLTELQTYLASNPLVLGWDIKPYIEQTAPSVTPLALTDGGVQRIIDDRDVPMPIYQESTIFDVQNATKEMLDSDDIITRAEEFGPFYVEGVGSIAAVTASPYYASRWMGMNYSVKSLYSGLTINYKIDVAGNGTYGTILDVNGLGPHPVCANVNTMVSTRYAVGCIINLIYDANQTATAYVNGTNTTFTGVWKIADYDSTIVYRLLQYYTRPLVNTNAGTVYGRQIILSKPDLSVIPVNNVNSGTGTYNKTLTTQSFDPFGPIYYFYYTGSGSYAPSSALPAGYLYRVFLADSRYSFNINSGGTAGSTALTANAPVYIKALYNDATKQATLAPNTSSTNYLELSSLTQSLPSANPNGSLSAGQRYIYIYLGHAYDKYQIEVSDSHQVYTWNKASSQMDEFTGAPLTHSSSFTFSNGQHSIIANYYKCGKQVTIYGDFGTTFISDTSSTFSLPFTPAQTSSVSLTGASTTTMVQLLGTISSTGLSLSAAWYQSSMSSSVSATISPMYYTQYVKDFQFSYITND